MRRVWFMAVFLLIGCGPSGAPVREEIQAATARPPVPSRPQKTPETAPTGPVATPSVPAPTDAPTGTDFRESSAIGAAFEIIELNRSELSDAKAPIEKLAARLEPVLPGFSRQLRWVLSRPFEAYRGSLTALLREAPLKLLTRMEQTKMPGEVLHHERGLIFAYEKWANETASARGLRVMIAVLDHLLQFESGEKLYCLSYSANEKNCTGAWDVHSRQTKPSKYAALAPVAEALLSGNEAFYTPTAIMEFLKPYGFQAPYLTHSISTGESVLAMLRELDGQALSPVKVTGDHEKDYAAVTECRFRLQAQSLEVTLGDARWDLQWSFKPEERFESYRDSEKPEVYRFYVHGMSAAPAPVGAYAEIQIARSPVKYVRLQLNELAAGQVKARASTIECGGTP